MAFGIYVHIPYCLQKCPYCDFAKYDISEVPNLDYYTHLLVQEIRQKQHLLREKTVTSLYFGGGTPSLMSVSQTKFILDEFKKNFTFTPNIEITLEVNPGTLSEEKLLQLRALGINRFSLGAQTFDNHQLTSLGRKHSSEDTRATLSLFNKHKVNFSMDLLFALPNQSLQDLKADLEICKEFRPPHVSTYYLNVPKYHALSKNRAGDDDQVQMFESIRAELAKINILQYEISNFAVPEFESQHNLIYWNDQPYWGVGLSSHSYFLSDESRWGARFFNPKTFESYEKYVQSLNEPPNLATGLPESHRELLEKHQSMTEYCYTSLRKMQGLNLKKFLHKFGGIPLYLEKQFEYLVQRNLLVLSNGHYSLSKEGIILSNLVFERLTFLKEDLY